MNQEIINIRTNYCELCGKKFTNTTKRKFCESCRKLEFRRNLKMAESIKRMKIYGKKTY